eukprot:TRINITY_DN5719_c0_g1_i3.p3 TRINITY_DN5719_c0_g1~~TRINITY_DN5719_c0_g1_i3.p3  ORF type:complete len:125 (-),score=23.27 TRINITY_DN5719_c0_g1_i3:155-529(-)
MIYFQQLEDQQLDNIIENELNDNTPFSPCNILSAQENMKIFKKEQFDVSKIKPQDIICYSPLITGRQDTIQTETGEIFSPNGGTTPYYSAQKQDDMRKQALLKNMAQNGLGQLLPKQYLSLIHI